MSQPLLWSVIAGLFQQKTLPNMNVYFFLFFLNKVKATADFFDNDESDLFKKKPEVVPAAVSKVAEGRKESMGGKKVTLEVDFSIVRKELILEE